MMEDEYHEQMIANGWAAPVHLPSPYPGMEGPFMIGGNLLLYDPHEGKYYTHKFDSYVGAPSQYFRRRIETDYTSS